MIIARSSAFTTSPILWCNTKRPEYSKIKHITWLRNKLSKFKPLLLHHALNPAIYCALVSPNTFSFVYQHRIFLLTVPVRKNSIVCVASPERENSGDGIPILWRCRLRGRNFIFKIYNVSLNISFKLHNIPCNNNWISVYEYYYDCV